MVLFQCRDLPDEIRNPRHKYSVLLGYYTKPKPCPQLKMI